MKAIVFTGILFLTVACSGGGAPNEAKAPTDATPAPDSSQGPQQLSLSDLQTKSLVSTGGSISVSGTWLTDTRCGFYYPVTASSDSAGVISITVNAWTGAFGGQAQNFVAGSAYTLTSHTDCHIGVGHLGWFYFGQSGFSVVNFGASDLDAALRVHYTIERVNGVIQVTRHLKTRGYRRGNYNATLGTTLYVDAERTTVESGYDLQ
jgi:hypothetical protein